jgi:hypothetical protein
MTTFADQPLEEQIAQWRAYVRRRQNLYGPDVEELEGHLRDQLAALTEAGLAGDEAFLVAVKRMGNLDALSREFALTHSERLWKQLVIASDAAPDGSEEPAKATRAETLVVLSLAVAAAIAIKVPALLGLGSAVVTRRSTLGTPACSSFRCAPSTSCGSAVGRCKRPLAGAALRGRGCFHQRLPLPRGWRH